MVNLADGESFGVFNPSGKSDIVLVCEHASAIIPAEFNNLGLDQDALASHIAWDPGAFDLSLRLAQAFNASLCYQRYSRLLYDCNRPPESDSAIRETSETYVIPGNQNLSAAERAKRVDAFYRPFQRGLEAFLEDRARFERPAVLVTVHSYTPVYFGKPRDVEIGILHDSDTRLADAMLETHCRLKGSFVTRRNEPYGPEDGVTHTLLEHGIQNGLLNVMIEVRNDLLQTSEGIDAVASYLVQLLSNALAPHPALEHSLKGGL